MASVQMIEMDKSLDVASHERPTYRRLGLLNGFLIGLALALGTWGWEALSLVRYPIRQQHPSLLLGGLLLIVVCTTAGWLSNRWAKLGITFLLWLLASVLATFIITYQPSYGRNIVIWLSDGRFWGRPIYPGLEAPIISILFAGFTIFLVLLVLAVLQDFRLQGIQGQMRGGRQMNGRSWLLLLWPLIFVFLAGYATNNIVGDKSTRDALLVKEAFDTGRTYEGDLFELGLERGLNFSAIEGVREMIGPDYSLSIGGVNPDALTTFVVANFDNGAWITCRVINGQLNFCYDAALPYTVGFASLINGQELPDDCRNCLPQVDEETAVWLRDQHDLLGDNPKIERLAQRGGYVLVEAASESVNAAIQCWFADMSPVRIESCTD